MNIRNISAVIIMAALTLSAGSVSAEPPGLARDFTYKQATGAVDIINKDGKVAARYVYTNTPKPYLYPLLAPNGAAITRGYPMVKIEGESTDCPCQRSFWIGCGSVNGIDFWTDGDKSGKIVQTKLDFNPISPGYWSIHTTDDWVGPDGKKVCKDERHLTFLSCDYGTIISSVIKLIPTTGQLVLGPSADGFAALRLAKDFELKGGKGHILNSEGEQDNNTWGKRARWCDYTTEINSTPCGVAFFDTPNNYGYSTYWNVNEFGLFAANPFGGKAFKGEPKYDSAMTIKFGSSATFVYIMLIHNTKLDKNALDDLADQIAGKGSQPRSIELKYMQQMQDKQSKDTKKATPGK